MFHYFYYLKIIECQLFYSSAIGNEETLESFELHICVKDYCFARDDALVGVAVMQLKDIVEQVKIKSGKKNAHRNTSHYRKQSTMFDSEN